MTRRLFRITFEFSGTTPISDAKDEIRDKTETALEASDGVGEYNLRDLHEHRTSPHRLSLDVSLDEHDGNAEYELEKQLRDYSSYESIGDINVNFSGV